MVVLDAPAFLVCAEPGCNARQKTRLCLLNSGGFAFENNPLWQVHVDTKQVGPYRALCPKHARLLVTSEPGPAGELKRIQ